MSAKPRRPEWGWAAPGRVNLMGEHTDYNDGWVLPFAIRQRTRCALRLRDDDRLRLFSAQAERPDEPVETTTATTPGDVSGWASYVAGVVWAMSQDGIDVPGADIWVDGDVPLGAGLSSSAALEVSVAVALDDTLGLDLGRRRLAELARRAENDYAGAPTGVMDQVASLYGRSGTVLLLDTRTMEIEEQPADLAAADLTLLVIDTRAAHELGDGAYASVRDDCERAARELGVSALRDATLEDLDRLGDEPLRRRARHIVTENDRVHEAVAQLRAGDWEGLGATFDASHASLRDDFRISCEELDVAVEAATAAGALGARMTGGGFGGSAVALVRRDDTAAVERACRTAFEQHGWREPHVFAVEPSPGAGRIEP